MEKSEIKGHDSKSEGFSRNLNWLCMQKRRNKAFLWIKHDYTNKVENLCETEV